MYQNIFKKLIIFFLLVQFNSCGQKIDKAENYLGDIYSSKNHPKSKGLNVTLRKPLGFKQQETDYPNMVQIWTKDIDSFNMVSIGITIKNMNDGLKKLTKTQLQQTVESLVKKGQVEKSFVLNTYPGFLSLITESDFERLDFKFKMYEVTSTTFVGNHIFNISLTTTDKNLIKDYRLLFNLVANSVVFPDQYN